MSSDYFHVIEINPAACAGFWIEHAGDNFGCALIVRGMRICDFEHDPDIALFAIVSVLTLYHASDFDHSSLSFLYIDYTIGGLNTQALSCQVSVKRAG